MRFGSTEIPQALHELARKQMAQSASFTPDDIRSYLLKEGADIINGITDIETNQWIVANNVFRAELKKLVAEKSFGQLKRGVWTRHDLLARLDSADRK
jgi:hypothetical protein